MSPTGNRDAICNRKLDDIAIYMRGADMERRSLRTAVVIIVLTLFCVCMVWFIQAENNSLASVYAEENQEMYDDESQDIYDEEYEETDQEEGIIASGVCGKDEAGNDSVFYDIYRVYDERAADEDSDPYDLIDDYKTVVVIHGTGPMYDYTKKTGLKSPFDKENFDEPVEVVIEDGVTRIGSKAFQNGWVGRLTIAGSVTSIGVRAFDDCIFQSQDIDINSIEVISENEIEYSMLPFCLKIPEGIKTVEKYAFYGAGGVDVLELPESLTTIEEYAFYELRIRELTIPEHVKAIGK